MRERDPKTSPSANSFPRPPIKNQIYSWFLLFFGLRLGLECQFANATPPLGISADQLQLSVAALESGLNRHKLSPENVYDNLQRFIQGRSFSESIALTKFPDVLKGQLKELSIEIKDFTKILCALDTSPSEDAMRVLFLEKRPKRGDKFPGKSLGIDGATFFPKMKKFEDSLQGENTATVQESLLKLASVRGSSQVSTKDLRTVLPGDAVKLLRELQASADKFRRLTCNEDSQEARIVAPPPKLQSTRVATQEKISDPTPQKMFPTQANANYAPPSGIQGAKFQFLHRQVTVQYDWEAGLLFENIGRKLQVDGYSPDKIITAVQAQLSRNPYGTVDVDTVLQSIPQSVYSDLKKLTKLIETSR